MTNPNQNPNNSHKNLTFKNTTLIRKGSFYENIVTFKVESKTLIVIDKGKVGRTPLETESLVTSKFHYTVATK